MIWKLKDGTVIETTSSSYVNGPDQQGGQCYGTTYHYYKIDNGEWVGTSRSQHKLYEAIQLSDTLSDFLELKEYL